MNDIFFKFRGKRYRIRRYSILGVFLTLCEAFMVFLMIILPFVVFPCLI